MALGIGRLRKGVAVLPAILGLAAAPMGKPPAPEQYVASVVAVDGWTAQKALLGKQLFEDPRLSRDGTVACGSCHRPELAFTDGRTVAVGVEGRTGARNTPTLVNRALATAQFWDGRAASLEEQALGPIQAPGEMNMTLPDVLKRLEEDRSYRQTFQRAFGGGPTPERLAEALAAYERTIYSVESAFDRYMAGDETALGESSKRGLRLFGGKAACGECHSGINFTDESFHNLGIGQDPGRARVTRKAEDTGAIKTPTLRELTRTAPYMHDGSLGTLAEVIDYYEKGCNPHPYLDSRIRKLGLTAQEKRDLSAFLESLSGRVVHGPSLETAGGGQ